MKRIGIALFLCMSTGYAQNVIWSINNPSPLVSVDKRSHFIVGAYLGAFGTAIAHQQGAKHPWVYGLLLATAAGIAKECYDRRRGGKAEIADGLNTAIGGACAGLTIQYSFRW